MMNRQMDVPAMQRIMREYAMNNERMEMSEEMMGDAIDDVMEEEGDEEEEENIVGQVLAELGIEADAVRAHGGTKPPALPPPRPRTVTSHRPVARRYRRHRAAPWPRAALRPPQRVLRRPRRQWRQGPAKAAKAARAAGARAATAVVVAVVVVARTREPTN